ncbi:MAG: hypothetical protein ACI9ND_000710 [Yoonia sp.]
MVLVFSVLEFDAIDGAYEVSGAFYAPPALLPALAAFEHDVKLALSSQAAL